MKILFISKNNIKKPLTLSIQLFVFLMLILISAISIAVYGVSNKLAKHYSDEKIETLKLDLDFASYQKSLQLYIQQIGEINARLADLDNQTERLQGILKKQIVGKQKLPTLPKKEKEFENQGGPFINSNLTDQDIQIALQALMHRMQIREDIFNETESIL